MSNHPQAVYKLKSWAVNMLVMVSLFIMMHSLCPRVEAQKELSVDTSLMSRQTAKTIVLCIRSRCRERILCVRDSTLVSMVKARQGFFIKKIIGMRGVLRN